MAKQLVLFGSDNTLTDTSIKERLVFYGSKDTLEDIIKEKERLEKILLKTAFRRFNDDLNNETFFSKLLNTHGNGIIFMIVSLLGILASGFLFYKILG